MSVLNTSAVGDLLCAFTVCNGGNASCRERRQGKKGVNFTKVGIFFVVV